MKLVNSIINYFLLAGVLTVLVIGCTDRSQEVRLKNKLDSLSTLATSRDSIVNDFLTSFNDIENSLDSITRRQMIIIDNSKSKSDIKFSTRERINQNIE